VGAHSSGTRFDYLFERIAAETTDEIPAVEAVVSGPRARRWWPVPVIAVVIQSWPGAGDAAPGPSGSTTHLVPTPIVTSVPVVEALPELGSPPEVTANVRLEPAPVSVAPPPPPQPSAPPPPSSRPETRQATPPTLRAPISVSPEPRPAFPNQHLPNNDNDNDGGRGGLLGRLGL